LDRQSDCYHDQTRDELIREIGFDHDAGVSKETAAFGMFRLKRKCSDRDGETDCQEKATYPDRTLCSRHE
jgi:hypothetical protein